MLFKKVLLEFFFSYQTCSALFSQKKRLSFDFCIFAKPLVQQMAKMVKKKKKENKGTVHIPFCRLWSACLSIPHLLYRLTLGGNWQYDRPQIVLPDCLTVSKLWPLGLGLGLK